MQRAARLCVFFVHGPSPRFQIAVELTSRPLNDNYSHFGLVTLVCRSANELVVVDDSCLNRPVQGAVNSLLSYFANGALSTGPVVSPEARGSRA